MRMIGRGIALITLLACATAIYGATSTTQPQNQDKLYVVGYAHLDTQWRWSYPQVIAEFLRNTMEDNFALFDKYPDYIFNFTGANRYLMMKQYYPEDFEKLKKYVAAGRWFPAGSSMEEGDVNMPNGESIIRQVLYGNEFFRKEFGKQSAEFMLPDCFGFQASLPSLLAHCGLKGFSTQKLTWGSAVGIPFNVGVWEGPDGRSIVAALNPLSYTSSIDHDLSHDADWQNRIEQNGKQSGVYVDYHYYGTGDRGGAPKESSVQWLEKSIAGGGPVQVISSTSEQMFVDLTPQQIAKLPRYKGDLLLTNHSAGSLTSEAYIKRWNRKNELLADAAERASVAADWLGSALYPRQKLSDAWTLVLGAHFHDTMAGTGLPKTYEYSWNNEVLALNQFAAVTQDAAGAVIADMDTRSKGVSIVVYNPLSIQRQDVAEATVTFPDTPPQTIEVVGPDGQDVPAQVVSRSGNQLKILFLASAPSVGFAAYDVRTAAGEPTASELHVDENSLENLRYRITLNADGDIASIYDKTNHHEALAAPARLAFLHEKPKQYPAWNMDWGDRNKPPYAVVQGPATIRIVENGPVRVALEVDRQAQGSRFLQRIRLASGSAGDRIEIASTIDWQTRESSLEAVFPLGVSNPMATYESQSAAVQRGNNNEKKFEVPQQHWFDLLATDGRYGVGILNDCKYGSDKPDDHTVRLTLLYTPGVYTTYQDQATQDIGRHEMIYALAPHVGSWQQGGVPWTAERLNQPLMTFQCSAHPGALGSLLSLLTVSDDRVAVAAIKKAEESDEVIVRLKELDGQQVNGVRVTLAASVESVREVDGQERTIGPVKVQDGGFTVDMSPFLLRAFAVKVNRPNIDRSPPVCQTVPLDYDLDAVSTHANLADGAFDDDGHSYAAETLPTAIVSEGIQFKLGPTEDGKNNAVICHGQTIQLPPRSERIYFLAAANGEDIPANFRIGDHNEQRTIQNWTGYIGQWDTRLWQGVVPELTYQWSNRFAGLKPGFIKRDTVAWFSPLRHDREKGNEYYRFAYLFKYALPAAGAKNLVLPDEPRIRIFAMTAVKNSHDDAQAARPLYDTLEDHVADASPTIVPAGGKFDEPTLVTINPPLYWRVGGIHYTVDGSEPTENSPVYAKAFVVSDSSTVRAKEVDGSGPEASAVFDVAPATRPAATTDSSSIR
jgi:alpha-mannosidase